MGYADKARRGALLHLVAGAAAVLCDEPTPVLGWVLAGLGLACPHAFQIEIEESDRLDYVAGMGGGPNK
jgi:hypothetical protein